jgi:CRISPR-associated Csx14 family protein
MSEEKITEDKYDVFLCYNSEDEPSVKKIGRELLNRRIVPWLDMWDIPPGRSWQDEIERQIEHIPTAAVFVGKQGIGPWQKREIRAWLREFVRRDCPVIPVLLEDAPDKPELPLLLQEMRWVDFRILRENPNLAPDEDPLNLLVWGITGQRAWKDQAATTSYVLIASLGESPVVVSAMYDLLTKQKRLAIDQVIVLHPQGEDIGRAYELVKEALADKCKVRCELLPFEDANSWANACLFLKDLHTLLDTCQIRGDTVCLSLAGGRKSMAALMAWVVPFFSCVKHLYHVIDPDEDQFLSIQELVLDLTPSQRKRAMHPADLERLIPVDIPFKPGQQINQHLISRLLSAGKDELSRTEYEEAEKADFVQTIAQEGEILGTLVTERVMEQYQTMCQLDRDAARHVRDCLERMSSTIELRNFQPDTFTYKPAKSAKFSSGPVDLHFFSSFVTPVRPVFYTRPKDIYTAWDNEVEQVVICELETGEDGRYRSLQEIAVSPGFSVKTAYPLKELPLVPPNRTTDSILIVPLGKLPMVATQLYTLLKHQEGRNIRKVILVYPAQATEIANGADLIETALQEEANVPCMLATIPDLKDIDSPDACRSYQARLEEVIDQVCENLAYTGCTIDLALSGGRKGMTAMTIFAAQKKHLPYVYHTLITDEELSREIDEQTTIEALNDVSLSSEERNDRLFLRTYEGNGPYTKFILFKVPVFPASDH